MFRIILVLKTRFHTSIDNLDRLFACNRISAQVWNDCLDLAQVSTDRLRRKVVDTMNLARMQQAAYRCRLYRNDVLTLIG